MGRDEEGKEGGEVRRIKATVSRVSPLMVVCSLKLLKQARGGKRGTLIKQANIKVSLPENTVDFKLLFIQFKV